MGEFLGGGKRLRYIFMKVVHGVGLHAHMHAHAPSTRRSSVISFAARTEERAGSRRATGSLFNRRNNIEIFRADIKDYPRVASLLVDAFYTDSKRPENNLSLMQKRSLERDQNLDLRARYGRTGKGPIESTILVADEEDDETIGCVALGTTPFIGQEAQLNIRDLYAYANRRDNGEACLRPVVANLAVRPDARRKGIAKKLMLECELVCKEWGYDEVWLLVEQDNPKARKLYKKLGYKQVKTEVDDSYKVVEGKIQQIDVTNVYMRKSLKPILGPIENADYPSLITLAALATAVVNDQVRNSALTLLRDQTGLDLQPQVEQILQLV